MYTKNDKILSDAGCILKRGCTYGYELDNDSTEDIEEIVINLDDMEIRPCGGFYIAVCNNNTVSFYVRDYDVTYAELKSRIVEARYSHADQIAVILNKDDGSEEHMADYERMQAWRGYAKNASQKIMDTLAIIA